MLCFAVFSICSPSYSQTPNATSEQVVGRVLTTGAYDGITDKQLGRMGDAAAIEVTKILGGKLASGQSISAFDVENVLLILHMAFAATALAVNVSDREPKTSLFVLDSLAFFTNDPSLKKSIADTTQFLLDQNRE
jgi:hypothetical protein